MVIDENGVLPTFSPPKRVGSPEQYRAAANRLRLAGFTLEADNLLWCHHVSGIKVPDTTVRFMCTDIDAVGGLIAAGEAGRTWSRVSGM